MNTNTFSRKAFENVASAVNALEQYHSTQRLDFLQNAELSLEQATKDDPNYLDAIFYCGVTKDLIGKPADAPAYFERIVKETNDANIILEAKYNLGVSYYHQYSHSKLERAEYYFNSVIKESNDESLQTLAKANLAQTYAMWL